MIHLFANFMGGVPVGIVRVMDVRLADSYRQFAEVEARGVSDIYFDWAHSIAEDISVVERISTLPRIKQQPNLVFAAARFLGAPVGPYAPFRDWLIENWDAVVPVIMERATQTNEAARCAVLLPVLSRLEGPLALIEAGASAGLVLYPDRYSYRYDVNGEIFQLDPHDGPSRVQLPCTHRPRKRSHVAPHRRLAGRSGSEPDRCARS